MVQTRYQPGETPPVSIAPMMERTDRHYRAFMRRITRHTLLYTEMITAQAIVHGDRDYLLGREDVETPCALQLGGDDPEQLLVAARAGLEYGYEEINLNIGCPSSRVQSGNFGVCLMKTPEVVRDCVATLVDALDVPVTVKHRIGVDELDRYEDMLNFVDVVQQAQPHRFTVHARKAWLAGLSPKDNRNIPPLRYEEVHQLKAERPALQIELNGGITTISQMAQHLERVDAVMLGRAAYDNPYLFAEVDRRFFDDDHPVPSRHQVVEDTLDYVERAMTRGAKLLHVARHMLNLFAGQRGARAWRRHISENGYQSGAGPEVLQGALKKVPTS